MQSIAPAHARSLNNPILNTGLQAAEAGAQVLLQAFEQGVEIRAKESEPSYNLVSDADLNSENAIATVLKQNFPDHSVLGEEEQKADSSAADLWIVDPLDGTNNFAHRIPHFAVSIAYYRNGQPSCGVVVNPVRGDWYYAVAGHGAFHNGRKMRVSKADKMTDTMIGCGFYYDRGKMMEATLQSVHDFFKQNIHGLRRFGTAALDLCQVADGLFGAFSEYKLSPWDFAAGKLIVTEAGGTITDCQGATVPLDVCSVLASNSLLHEKALDIVKTNHPD